MSYARDEEERQRQQANSHTTPPPPPEIPTIEIGREYIEDFYQRVTTIFYDTIDLVFTENSKLAGIGQHHTNRMYESYMQIQQEINAYLDSGVPADIVAQAIADNVELDYTIAMALSPPSDIIILFDQTVEQLQGVWAQINDKLQERIQEMENEFYGI